jgi:DNA-binding NarL/FixJ family response regulator
MSRRRSVLIVDDDSRFRDLLRQLLEASDDFEVVGEAGESDAALASARELDPDVVLLDVQLADVLGFELVPRIAPGGEGPRIVMISARDDLGYAEMAGEAGATGFVSKHDLTLTALREVLERAA